MGEMEAAYKKYCADTADYHQSIKDLMPHGKTVKWRTGSGHMQTGTVLRVSGDRAWVVNHKTGKEIRLDFWYFASFGQ